MDLFDVINNTCDRLLQIMILIAAILIIGRLTIMYYKSDNYKNRPKLKQLRKDSKEKANGILFGKYGIFNKIIYSPTNAEGHIFVGGGSGLGKTSAILIPTIRSWLGTVFCIDISGDIESNCDVENKIVYTPSNPKSTPYNIFGPIDGLAEQDDKNEKLEQLALLLMPEEEKANDASKFFTTEGRKILTASFIAFYHKGMDFVEICEKVFSSSWKSLFSEIDETKNQKAIQYINSFVGASEQNTSGCKQAADAAIKLFATNERVKNTIRRPMYQNIAYEPTRLEKYNVFVNVEDSKLELYAPLLNIITSQTLEYLSDRKIKNDSKTILLCLDEFASLGKLEITSALRKLRKKLCRIMLLTQSMADIDLIYGRNERMAMMNNFRFKAILGADDTDTQEYFAKLIGRVENRRESVIRSENGTSYTESPIKEYAVDPETLGRLGKELILLYPDGWVKLRKNFYYQ